MASGRAVCGFFVCGMIYESDLVIFGENDDYRRGN
jgi:hypothetical protein